MILVARAYTTTCRSFPHSPSPSPAYVIVFLNTLSHIKRVALGKVVSARLEHLAEARSTTVENEEGIGAGSGLGEGLGLGLE